MGKRDENSPLPKLAVIGCGNISERAYLPSLRRLNWRPVAFVDPSLERARAMAKPFKNARAVTSLDELQDGEIEAAIVATPHQAHEEVCVALLRRGIHVHVEKPMATTVAACDAMISAAEGGGVTISVGHFRRYLHVLRLVRRVLERGLLGDVRAFKIREGYVYDWEMKSDSLLKREAAGGGVLMDLGSHAVDSAIWLFGEPKVVDYADDSAGGVESEALLHLKLENGATGVIELSRTRELSNSLYIEGSEGVLEVSLQHNSALRVPKDLTEKSGGDIDFSQLPVQPWSKLFEAQLIALQNAVHTGHPKVSGVESIKTVALIRQCYRMRQSLTLPWESEAARQPISERPSDRRWLVTGATGFIGGRLVEKLFETGVARPICMVHRRAAAVRISRFPVDTVFGSIDDRAALQEGVAGCDAIIHCAHDLRSPNANLRAVDLLIELAKQAGVRRLVHVSSLAVYEPLRGTILNEEGAREHKGWSYQDSKLATERRVLEEGARAGLNVIVLQPTIVYGPYGGPWTKQIVERLLAGGIALPDQGEGVCNPVFVDDVVDALIRAASTDVAPGGCFLISGPHSVKWSEFFAAFEQALGRKGVRLAADEEFGGGEGRALSATREFASNPARLLKMLAQHPRAREVMSSLYDSLPESGQHFAHRLYNYRPSGGLKEHVPQGAELLLYQAKTQVDIGKAREELGFDPVWDFSSGMESTARWIQWSYVKNVAEN